MVVYLKSKEEDGRVISPGKVPTDLVVVEKSSDGVG